MTATEKLKKRIELLEKFSDPNTAAGRKIKERIDILKKFIPKDKNRAESEENLRLIFKQCKNANEVKKTFYDLALTYHPDRGGDVRTMQILNNLYKEFLKKFDGQTNETGDGESSFKYKFSEEIEDQLLEIISLVISFNMVGVQIYLIGAWIWAIGETKPYKEQLKEVGFRWSKPREYWYFRNEQFASPFGRSERSLSDLAREYGGIEGNEYTNKKPKTKPKKFVKR